MAQSETSDAALLDAWRAGDKAAGTALFRRHYSTLARFFTNKIATEHHPDLMQKTMLACVEARERFEGKSSFSTFLIGIALRQLYRHYRNTRRDQARFDACSDSVEELDPSPSQLVARRDERRVLLSALRRIPLEYQLVLELLYWENFSTAMIAESLGVPLGTAKSRIRRGRELLRAQIEAITDDPGLLDSTLTRLEDWARGLRELASGA